MLLTNMQLALRNELRNQCFTPIGSMDMMIAAHAKSMEVYISDEPKTKNTLYQSTKTENRKLGLEIANWAALSAHASKPPIF